MTQNKQTQYNRSRKNPKTTHILIQQTYLPIYTLLTNKCCYKKTRRTFRTGERPPVAAKLCWGSVLVTRASRFIAETLSKLDRQ